MAIATMPRMRNDAGVATVRAWASRWLVAASAIIIAATPTMVRAQTTSQSLQCRPPPAAFTSEPGLVIRAHGAVQRSDLDPVRCATVDHVLFNAIETALARNGVVFLGEVHDNAAHHRLRAAILDHLSATRSRNRLGLVFEHIREDQQNALIARDDAFTARDLFARLKWSESGWPDQAMFEPLFTAALKAGGILPGEPDRGRVRNVARQGLAALGEADIKSLRLDQPFAATAQEALLTELEASHCGLMPKTAFTNMALAQRYRDAVLARAAQAADFAFGATIVLTGNGHARRDRGAPLALKAAGFGGPVLVVLFIESAPDSVDPAIADVVVSTPPAPRKDPCDDMRARFGKKG